MRKMMEMLKEIKDEISKVRNDVALFKIENTKLQERVQIQEKQIEYLEREAKKKNLIIKGIKDTERETYIKREEEIVKLMKTIGVKMGTDSIDMTYRIGRFNPEKERPIVVKLTYEKSKYEILRNAKNLKGSNVWIDEDFTQKTQDERRTLIPMMKEIRSEGKTVVLRYNKLIVDGKVYTGEVNRNTNKYGKRSINEWSPGNDMLEKEGNRTNKNPKK